MAKVVLELEDIERPDGKTSLAISCKRLNFTYIGDDVNIPCTPAQQAFAVLNKAFQAVFNTSLNVTREEEEDDG